MFGNINMLPSFNENVKNDTLCDFITMNDFDIVGLSEVNKYWPNVPIKDRPSKLFAKIFESSHVK